MYPTQTVIADGTAIERTSSATYDCYTGLVLTTTDVDNDLTNATEYDDIGRPVKAISAQGKTGFESWVQTTYHDPEPEENGDKRAYVVVRSDLETVGDGKNVATQFFDQLGRVRLSKTLEDSSTQSATNETDGIKVQTRYLSTYSSPNGYTYQLTSNPYRASVSTSETDVTMGWTRSKAWHTGKKSEVETFSGAALPAPWGSNSNTSGKATTDIDANATTVEDQAGKKRRSITNAFGQMVEVIEDPAGQNLSTTYVFDTLGNLRKTTQDNQNRYFMYSSLGRLLFAKQPEQETNTNLTATDPVTSNTAWSVKYLYDNNGNITSTTDALNKTVTATYDALGRITLRDYSDTSMPDVTFTYDEEEHAFGKLNKVSTSVSETRYTGFDALGRVVNHEQYTNGETYATEYKYNLSGALVEETYPSGRVVQHTFDKVGRFSQVKSKKNSSHGFFTYANSPLFNAAGAMTRLQLGSGRWETASFNSRMQIEQIGLGVTNNTQNLLKLEFDYGNSTQNNGNLLEQKITVPTVGESSGFTAIQNYTYDGLNRLQSATEEIDETETWKQTFSFDRYGNRRFNTESNNTTTLPESFDPDVFNPTISAANNRFSGGQGYSYDANGNVTEDAKGQRFGYDAENHQKEYFASTNGGSTPDATYHYDGDGRRIRKIVGSEVTIFVYNAGGQLVAEYSTQTETTEAQVSYLTTDHLGSPRIITDENGVVTSRKDFAPFGEETVTDERTTALGYNPPNIRQDFTGYEKDEESGFQFAQARYFNPNHGRFASVDPLTASMSMRNPQTFNRYAYVLNRPLSLIDPTGMEAENNCNGKDVKCPNTKIIKPGEQQLPIGEVTITAEADPITTTTIAPMATAITYRPLENTNISFNTQNFANAMSFAPVIVGAAAAAGTEEFPVIGTGFGAGIGLLGALMAATLAAVEITTISTSTTTTTTAPPPGGPGMFRGGPSLMPLDRDVKIRDGLVQPTHGVSVNIDPLKVMPFGGAYRVGPLPPGLTFLQRGTRDPGHFEITPTTAITLERYTQLLRGVTLTPYKP